MAFNLRLTDVEDQQLSSLAAGAGQSKQQFLTALIRREWEAQDARRISGAMLDEIMSTRADLMERLKDA